MTQHRRAILLPIFRLTLWFIVLQGWVAFIKAQELIAVSSPILQQFSHGSFTQTAVWLPIVSFLIAHGVLMASYISILFWITDHVAQKIHLPHEHDTTLAISLWCLFTVTLLLGNGYYYPHSIFAYINQLLAYFTGTHLIAQGLFYSTLLLSLLVTLLAFIHWVTHASKKSLIFATVLCFLLSTLFFFHHIFHRKFIYGTFKNPHIIILGVDSLPPEYFNSPQGNVAMPHLQQWLQHSVQFTHAYTPIARTNPSWVSLLTGDLPQTHHMVFNLAPPTKEALQHNLQRTLQHHGYFTLYGTDERRFSNVDERFGFNIVVGPHPGFNDFLLGMINDFPLSNLLLNTPIGSFLFPYSYGNRAAQHSYYPPSFNHLLTRGLTMAPKDKPLFAGIHLCVSHWPYTWHNSPGEKALPAIERSSFPYYFNALHIADKQFHATLKSLKKTGILKNAIVVVVSDHGETFGLPHEHLPTLFTYTGSDNKQHFHFRFPEEATGHGTDVLAPQQYHTLLGWQRYKNNNPVLEPNKKSQTWVSLIDITPTLLHWLNIIPTYAMDGESLLPLINNEKNTLVHKPLHFESGIYFPPQYSQEQHLADVLHEKIRYYHITSKGLLELNASGLSFLVDNKQYAILQWPYLQVDYPESNGRQKITVNLKKKTWWLH